MKVLVVVVGFVLVIIIFNLMFFILVCEDGGLWLCFRWVVGFFVVFEVGILYVSYECLVFR